LEEEDAIDLEYKSLGYPLSSDTTTIGSSSPSSSRKSRASSAPTAGSVDDEKASDSGFRGGHDQEDQTRVERFVKERQGLKTRILKVSHPTI